MTATARHARHGAVTVAARAGDHHGRAAASPATCSASIEGDFAVVGDDLLRRRRRRRRADCSAAVASWSPSSPAPRTAERARRAVRRPTSSEHHPHVDVVVYDGGQERYPLLVAVE